VTDEVATMEIRHGAIMLHTQTVVDENAYLKRQVEELTELLNHQIDQRNKAEEQCDQLRAQLAEAGKASELLKWFNANKPRIGHVWKDGKDQFSLWDGKDFVAPTIEEVIELAMAEKTKTPSDCSNGVK